ncbi:MAG TPA: CPBP family intramembrane glutamic endopeptidase [Bryobacteraceae bacterium]|nr:CPBP family intramembrane glutamic endopeptidase [Bryobacteraceae bacterium]
MAVLPAFLVEIAFYLTMGFPEVRKAFDGLGSKTVRAALLLASGIVPYLVVSFAIGNFQIKGLLTLAAVTFAVSFWYAWIRPNLAMDILFLGLLAAVYLGKIFDPIYGLPAPHVQLSILGRLMLIRVSVMAVLSLRSIEETHLGFVPSWRDWKVGVLYYLCFMPVGASIAYLVRFARFRAPELVWWKLGLLVFGTFLAFFWVVALFEEFFFRAFLQRRLARVLKSDLAGLAVASVLFGLVHLAYPPAPNWRFAIVGGVSGVFYGLAFLRAQSVRASMVTHALVVVTWRVFFHG